MYKYKNDICDLCSSATQNTIDLFCNEINNTDADVYIVMSHKAVLLFQVLLEQNHINTYAVANKIIISNQALEFDCSYLLGKRIAIIDDIVISGTSIATVVDNLLSIGIPQCDISIIALAINKNYLAMSFENADGQSALRCNTVAEDATCIELSYFISNVFTYYGIPYDVDFPIYNAIKINEEKMNLIFNDFLWETHKICNNYRKYVEQVSDVDSYTLFPRKNVREMIWERIGINLDKCIHLKIRLYIKHYPSGKKECHLTPLCIFNYITENNVNELYNLFKPSGQKININKNNSFVTKMRYIQYYIAHQLYLIFKDVTSLCGDMKPLEKSTKLLFGMNDGVKIYNALNSASYNHSASIHLDVVKCINTDLLDEYSASNIAQEATKNIMQHRNQEGENQGYWINHSIFSPFLWWYDTQEIPVRNELKENPKHYINDLEKIKSMTTRLNSGFSLPILKSILSDSLSGYDSETLISLFIDRAIDEGIVVPTIYYDKKNHYLCRAYRHGEDLPFGIADQCRLLYFLKVLSEQIPNIKYVADENEFTEGIAQISMEKIIVLFYQMGLKRGNIFNRFLGFNNIKLLKTFLSLHGTIEGVIEPQKMEDLNIKEHIYSERADNGYRYITWLTNWLLEKNFIKDIDEQKRSARSKLVYYINRKWIDKYLSESERSCISPTIKNEISNIAKMISVWYNYMAQNKGKKRFKEDSIALTSCSDVFVYASAIATEIHYFSKFWGIQVEKAFDQSYDNNDLIQILNSTNYDEDIEQALNSGRNKVMWFDSQRAAEVVSEVSDILNNNGTNIWGEFWGLGKSVRNTANGDLHMYIDQAIGFLYFYSACYDCLKSKSFWESGEKPKNYEIYKKYYEDQCRKTELLAKDLFSKIENIMELSDFSQKKLEFNQLVKNSLVDSEDSVHNIEYCVENCSPNYTVRYKSSLIFDVKPLNESNVENIIMNVWNNLEDIDLKTQINIIKFPFVSSDKDLIRYGFFYDISSNNKTPNPLHCGEVLISIYNKLCDAFNGKVYEIRAILLPDTPPGRMFEHNVQRNIDYYAKKFNDNIINILKNSYVTETKQQLVLAMTDYVDTEFYNIIEAMGWDHHFNSENTICAEVFAKVTTYYNEYIKPDSNGKKDVTYSIVKIKCGSKWGTGFLLRTSDQIVCVTCNHVLTSVNHCQLIAVSSYFDEEGFQVTPLKEIVSYDYSQSALSAFDEISILIPQWNGRILFDANNILSLEDLTSNINNYIGQECVCCGFHSFETLEYDWSDSIKLGNRVAKGYYNTKIDNNGENPVREGFSGGIIVLNDNDLNCIIGIHERHEGNDGRLIPCSIINKVIRKYQNGKK